MNGGGSQSTSSHHHRLGRPWKCFVMKPASKKVGGGPSNVKTKKPKDLLRGQGLSKTHKTTAGSTSALTVTPTVTPIVAYGNEGTNAAHASNVGDSDPNLEESDEGLDFSTLRVMIAGKEEHCNGAVRSILREHGTTVVDVPTSREAIDMLLAEPDGFDFILCDMVLGGVSFSSIVQEIRPAGCQTPFIALTITPGTHTVSKCLKSGAVGCIQPPFSGEQFRNSLLLRLEATWWKRRAQMLKTAAAANNGRFVSLDGKLSGMKHDLERAWKDIDLQTAELEKRDHEILTLKSRVSELQKDLRREREREREREQLTQNSAPAAEEPVELSPAQKVQEVLETPLQKVQRRVREMIRSVRDERMEKGSFESKLGEISKCLATQDLHKPDMLANLTSLPGMDKGMVDWVMEEYTPHNNVLAALEGMPETSTAPQKEPTVHRSQLPPLMPSDIEGLKLWSFDVWSKTTEELVALGAAMFENLGIIQNLSLSEDGLVTFLSIVSENYFKNPYHNFRHAFDVTQTIFTMIHHMPFKDKFTPLELFAALISGWCHDVGHPGKTNVFQVNAETQLALIYNDVAVLENHHAARTFHILQNDAGWLLSPLTPSDRKEFRRLVIKWILATDMSHHFQTVSEFSTRVENNPFDFSKTEDRCFFMEGLIHLADISNAFKPYHVSFNWSKRVQEEFLAQGDREKALKLAVSPNMDRSSADIKKMNLGFIDIIVAPLLRSVARCIPEMRRCVSEMENNRAQWGGRRSLEDDVKAAEEVEDCTPPEGLDPSESFEDIVADNTAVMSVMNVFQQAMLPLNGNGTTSVRSRTGPAGSVRRMKSAAGGFGLLRQGSVQSRQIPFSIAGRGSRAILYESNQPQPGFKRPSGGLVLGPSA